MTKARVGMETALIIMLGIVLSFFITGKRSNRSTQSVFSAPIPVTVTPEPTQEPVGLQVFIMDSPDGNKALILEKQEDKGRFTDSLFVTEKPYKERQLIFKNEEQDTRNFEIPFNTWSPNTRYVFLKEKTKLGDNYLAFQSNGNLFPNDMPFISVSDLFKEKVEGYLIEEVTGWGDMTTLIINTKSLEGDAKKSFWFDAMTLSFSPLGTYFR